MMQSKITIERDDQSGMPYFKIHSDTTSEDLRDKSIKLFRHKFQGVSNWARVDFSDHPEAPNGIIFIRPITPKELREQAAIMLAAADDLLEKASS